MNNPFSAGVLASWRPCSHAPGQLRGMLFALCLGLSLSGCSRVAANSAAGAAAAGLPLLGTPWSLVSLDGPAPTPAAPTTAPGMQAAQLRFEAEPPRVTGSTGCNRLTGAYVLDGTQLRFTTPATTRRACLAEGADASEHDLLSRLDQVRAWRIEGDLLLLTDASGTPVLRLQAAR